jgi:hypothetical protein
MASRENRVDSHAHGLVCMQAFFLVCPSGPKEVLPSESRASRGPEVPPPEVEHSGLEDQSRPQLAHNPQNAHCHLYGTPQNIKDHSTGLLGAILEYLPLGLLVAQAPVPLLSLGWKHHLAKHRVWW